MNRNDQQWNIWAALPLGARVGQNFKVKGDPVELTYKQFYEITGSTQHAEFERYLKDVLFDPTERNKFYARLNEVNHNLGIDTFKPYFELYAAERKSHQQDYTPDSVANLLALLTRSDAGVFESSKYSGYDPTAGTGSLIIQKWHDDRAQETPWSYAPHRYLYRADELADNVIPYLIHNLAFRGMNALVVHGDVLEGRVKQVYFIQNSNDDFMAYSDVNVMPHSDDCAREFGVTEWLEDEIKHIESQKVVWRRALPMKRKALEVNPDPKPGAWSVDPDRLLLKHVAVIERAKKGKDYPAGTVVVQLSATKGQVGLLKSSGEIASHYAAINMIEFIDPYFAWMYLQREIPKHFRRVQEGLNVPLEEIGNCPFSFPIEAMIALQEAANGQLEMVF